MAYKMKQSLLIITSLLFITSTVFPQSKINVNSLKEHGGKAFEVYDDGAFLHIDDSGKLYYSTKVDWKNVIPYTGKVFDLDKSTGKKTLQGQYKKGLKTGLWTEWNRIGQKEEERTYKDDEKDGLWTEWYENGQKAFESIYKNGYPISLEEWNEDGSVKE